MAIMGPMDLPSVLKVRSDPMKKYVLAQLGYPHVEVEISEDQWEIALRVTGDWIAGYFPREQKLAVFYTKPLTPTYPLPEDAYWIQEVSFDPNTTNVFDIFSNEAYLYNIGNVSGIQNMLLDLHLLQAYRKFASKILGTEGHWEVINEGGEGPTNQLIRLYPTPKGAFPVTVLYYPIVTHFRSPQAKKLACDMLLAEAKCMLGHVRRKLSNMPGPTGGSLGLDGGDLITEGTKMKDDITKQAIEMGEPMQFLCM